MQYAWQRRARVAKDLRRGRSLSTEDLPVASALVALQQSQRKWQVIAFGLLPFNFLVCGINQDGFLRWVFLGLAVYSVLFVPLVIHQQRQMVRNYQRLSQ